MEQISHYVRSILQGSFLRKQEKQELKEEMEAHLHSSIDDLQQMGMTKEEAVKRAIERFGEPDKLRQQVTKETFGLSGDMIMKIAGISLLFALLTFLSGLILNKYGIHNRYIELAPIVGIGAMVMTLSLTLTRKRIDRICLIVSPIFFVVGFLQSYFKFLVYRRDGFEFMLFEFHFSSVLYDKNYGSITFSSLILIGFVFILYLVSRNKYVALMPLAWSIVFTLTHAIVIQTYLFFYSRLTSPVVSSYAHVLSGNSKRVLDIVLKVAIITILFALFVCIEKGIRYWKRRSVA
ncbi:permease prefix domain 1-containing protein [Paenibacillus sp. GCM10027626]|uniref:permease prefix domain 1-containing protein n=1 Tax=Paenibacillus sp. GCM10027626 TaxID=3273411 RepID=UPI00362DA8C0